MLKPIFNYHKFSEFVLFRSIISCLLLLSLIILPVAQPILGQQQNLTIEQLKQQISLLESVTNNADTSADVKEFNQKLLQERINQLQISLKKKIDSTKEYFSKVESALSNDEKIAIKTMIANLEDDLKATQRKVIAVKPNNSEINPNYLASTNPVYSANSNETTLQNPIKDTVKTNFQGATTASILPEKSSTKPLLQANPVQAGCFPNASQDLINEVNNAANIIVTRNDPTRFSEYAFQIFFFAMIDALSVDNEVVENQKKDFVKQIEITRLKQQTKITNKQIGSTARAEGTTSAIEKPDFAQLLGFAIENGAIQKEVSGTNLTLSTSPYAFVTATQGDTATVYKNYGYLSRLGMSASFNIANEENVLLNTTRNQLSEWNMRLRLSGDKTSRSQEAEDIWNTKIRSRIVKPSLVITDTFEDIFKDPTLNRIRIKIVDGFNTNVFTAPATQILGDGAKNAAQKEREIADLILCRVKSEIIDSIRSGSLNIPNELRQKIIRERLTAYNQAVADKNQAVEDFEKELKQLTFKPTFALAYTNKRETESSDYSTLKFLFEKKVEEKLNFNVNAGFSVYHKPNRMLNQKQYRDFAMAFSFEGLFGRSPFLSEDEDESQITYAFTGRYQRLFENEKIANKKADIGAGQFKLEIPFFTGLSLPLSVTYSNATEELRKDGVRFNFGVNLDTDKVFQVLKLKRLKNQ